VAYLPKDFIQTPEGLIFAVIAEGLEENKVLCFLRYQQTPNGWQKLNTQAATNLLASHTPDYRHYSALKDTVCHAVPLSQIIHHFQPRHRLQLLLREPTTDPILQDCVDLVRLLQDRGIDSRLMGVTGSLLVGTQQAQSDIDLVFYDRQVFYQTRQLLRDLMARNQLQALTTADWLVSYQRRDCALNFADYAWHERRKMNKVMINGRKVDLSLLTADVSTEGMRFQKLGAVTRVLKVVDDTLAYDYPAEFKVDASDVEQVVCFTATYTGQAFAGEWITVAGQLEVAENGLKRIVVGASREAHGEYIKVMDAHA
jgi:predicted nucleotidyltransferase